MKNIAIGSVIEEKASELTQGIRGNTVEGSCGLYQF